jgi:hypothetical protein
MKKRDAWAAYKAAAAEMARASQQVIDAWDAADLHDPELDDSLHIAIERLRAALEAGRLPSNQGRPQAPSGSGR